MSSLGSNDPEFMKAKEKLLEAFRMQYGIDTPPTEAKKFLSLTEERLKELGTMDIEPATADCSVCNDGRRIRLTNDRKSPYFGQTFPCPECTPEDKLVRATGVDEAYAAWNLDQLDIEPKLIADAIAYLTAGDSLVMYGKVGRGKTHMAVGLLREWIKRGGVTGHKYKPAKFIYFPQFLDDMRELFGDERSAQQAQHYETQLARYDLLVVDDLGAERTSDWVIERVNVLFDRRLHEGKQTVVTTNLLTLGDVEARYGARTASRLGGYRWHECSGIDHRLSL